MKVKEKENSHDYQRCSEMILQKKVDARVTSLVADGSNYYDTGLKFTLSGSFNDTFHYPVCEFPRVFLGGGCKQRTKYAALWRFAKFYSESVT